MRPPHVRATFVLVSLAALTRAAVAAWSPNGVALCARLTNELSPAIVSDETGGAVMCWQDNRNLAYGSGPDLYAQRVSGSGATKWTTNGVVIAKTSGTQAYPRLAPDGLGGAFVVWWDDRQGAHPASLYASRVEGDGTIAAGWPENGLAVAAHCVNYIRYAIAADGVGGAFVAWEDSTRLPGLEIVVQRIGATGAVANGWAPGGTSVAPLATDQVDPDLLADGAGGVYVAWTDVTASPSQSNIRLQHLTASGVVAAGWPAAGLAIVATVNAQESPRLVADGSGGAIVAWVDARGGPNQMIYAQRVTAAGTALWTPHGVPFSAARHPVYTLRAASDGAGGAHLTWADQRYFQPLSTAYVDLYAQRITGAGAVAPGWNPGGVVLCGGLDSWRNPGGLVHDGAGGAFYAWSDGRPGGCTVYTHHLSGSGTIEAGGAVNGVRLIPASSMPGSPGIIRPRFGGAIVGFNDNRQSFGTNYNVYAVWLDSGALVAAADPPGLASGFGIESVTPNPSRAGARVALRLSGGAPATFEVFDVQGRLRQRATLGAGEGREVVLLRGETPLEPGIYTLKLRQTERVASRRAVVIR